MDSKTKKLALIGAAVVAVGAGVTLALQAFNENLVFFFSPTQVAAKEAPTGRTFRLGGVVEPGSVKRQADGVTVTFGITDTAKIVPVQYKGILPDLFAEGQGVVAQGKLDEQGVFCASEVLAKHDANAGAGNGSRGPQKGGLTAPAGRAGPGREVLMPALPVN